MTFDVLINGQPAISQVVLNLPGEHNVQNALAAIAIVTQLGVDDQAIINGLDKF